jgi:hypothetical protein
VIAKITQTSHCNELVVVTGMVLRETPIALARQNTGGRLVSLSQ